MENLQDFISKTKKKEIVIEDEKLILFIILVFRFLPLKYLIQCKYVCKRWNHAIEEILNSISTSKKELNYLLDSSTLQSILDRMKRNQNILEKKIPTLLYNSSNGSSTNKKSSRPHLIPFHVFCFKNNINCQCDWTEREKWIDFNSKTIFTTTKQHHTLNFLNGKWISISRHDYMPFKIETKETWIQITSIHPFIENKKIVCFEEKRNIYGLFPIGNYFICPCHIESDENMNESDEFSISLGIISENSDNDVNTLDENQGLESARVLTFIKEEKISHMTKTLFKSTVKNLLFFNRNLFAIWIREKIICYSLVSDSLKEKIFRFDMDMDMDMDIENSNDNKNQGKDKEKKTEDAKWIGIINDTLVWISYYETIDGKSIILNCRSEFCHSNPISIVFPKEYVQLSKRNKFKLKNVFELNDFLLFSSPQQTFEFEKKQFESLWIPHKRDRIHSLNIAKKVEIKIEKKNVLQEIIMTVDFDYFIIKIQNSLYLYTPNLYKNNKNGVDETSVLTHLLVECQDPIKKAGFHSKGIWIQTKYDSFHVFDYSY